MLETIATNRIDHLYFQDNYKQASHSGDDVLRCIKLLCAKMAIWRVLNLKKRNVFTVRKVVI